mmetsp:Transcript_20316/g.49368  ORF Transcript_20316/g.49368 Transcript_20316/m.49368 type:complete len:363 (-) Transcript_20316:10-1098(-)
MGHQGSQRARSALDMLTMGCILRICTVASFLSSRNRLAFHRHLRIARMWPRQLTISGTFPRPTMRPTHTIDSNSSMSSEMRPSALTGRHDSSTSPHFHGSRTHSTRLPPRPLDAPCRSTSIGELSPPSSPLGGRSESSSSSLDRRGSLSSPLPLPLPFFLGRTPLWPRVRARSVALTASVPLAGGGRPFLLDEGVSSSSTSMASSSSCRSCWSCGGRGPADWSPSSALALAAGTNGDTMSAASSSAPPGASSVTRSSSSVVRRCCSISFMVLLILRSSLPMSGTLSPMHMGPSSLWILRSTSRVSIGRLDDVYSDGWCTTSPLLARSSTKCAIAPLPLCLRLGSSSNSRPGESSRAGTLVLA